MSDGLSDCARSAESRAERFVKEKYPGLKRIQTAGDAPKHGTVVLVYEEWLDHVVEIITDRQVVKRYSIAPFKDEPRRMSIGKEDWPVGYYRDHHIPMK